MAPTVAGLTEIRLAELMAALSVATDLAMGQPLEFALSSCVLAVRLGTALKLDEADKAFMAATRDFKKCVWGHGTARKEKWTPKDNWWYFRTPLRSNAQLEDELATVR